MTAVRIGAYSAMTALGVLVTHGLAYLLAHPQASDRHEALAGHGHLETVTPTIAAAGVAAVALIAVLGGRRGTLRRVHPRGRTLMACQLAGFVSLEVVERLDAPTQLAAEPAVLAGVLVAAPVALALLGTITTVAHVVSRVGLEASPAWTVLVEPGRLAALRSASLRPVPVRSSPISRRGPPSLVV